MKNNNHPSKGASTKVEPIKSLKSIKHIKKMLEGNLRNYCLFVMGINTAYRASDLLSLKVCQVRGLQAGESIEFREKKTMKTGKRRRVTLNKACINAIKNLLASRKYLDSDYLFMGRTNEALTVSSLNNLVKEWCRGEMGNYGSHSLRKTWGYHHRIRFNVPVPLLMAAYGHSSEEQTMTYLCIQPEEIKAIYENEI